MSDATYKLVKHEFILELDYLSYIGRKIFIHPFLNRSKTSVTCYAIITVLISLTALQLFITLCVTALTTTNWFELINIAPNLGVVLMTLTKYYKIHQHRSLYEEIFEHYRKDIWTVEMADKDYQNIISQYTKITKIVTRFLFYYCIPLIIVVNSFPRIMMYYEVNVAKKEKEYLLPYDGWYPFDKINWYYIAYLWEGSMTVLVIGIVSISNSIHVAYTYFICMELKVLGQSIENLITVDNVNDLIENIDVRNTLRVINNELKDIARRHQVLAGLSSRLNTVLGDTMLLTYFFGSVFMGLTFFTATVEDNIYKALRYFFMCCSLVVDSFYQCMIGQVLINHSENLAHSIYSADWTYADSNTKSSLLILMIRAQKPFQYTAKGYLSMNLNTFSAICSLSFQLFNLVRRVYE
ncbi:putative odorant receptor 85d [Plodia interpunctella]|uniref:putative odorant receptor 85d n=1 Tax=Plodia interpunctella TaxID=58824 RepID=UPI0023674D88|nr:putative odorant receptor 85d [Plodia interpunctella]